MSRMVFHQLNRYYPKSFKHTLEQLSASERWESGLSEEELDDVWNAIIDEKIEINLWIWLFDYQFGKEFSIIWGSYKGRRLAFQSSEDWGVILHSIRWGENNSGEGTTGGVL